MYILFLSPLKMNIHQIFRPEEPVGSWRRASIDSTYGRDVYQDYLDIARDFYVIRGRIKIHTQPDNGRVPWIKYVADDSIAHPEKYIVDDVLALEDYEEEQRELWKAFYAISERLYRNAYFWGVAVKGKQRTQEWVDRQLRGLIAE